ncbi:MAG TPA: hypothetical protein ENJ31_08290 [Anaerolineae bacterium]|nr:hypothetical protein [Anaerolineae bacterium]
MLRSFQGFAIVLMLASVLLVACGPTPTPEPDQVTLQLNWYHEAEFAGYYVAEAQGFYADENIALTIREGGLDVDVVQALLGREVDISVFGSAEQRKAMEEGNQTVALMAAFQISPRVLFALADSGIQKPQDLVGRRVAIKSEGWRQTIHETLANVGVDPAEIVEVEVKSDAIQMLYDGDVDVWTGYVHDEPVETQLAGYDVNLIFPGDYGVGAYEGLLCVSQETLEQNSDLVARFMRATLRGWQYAIEHPDEAAEVIAKWDPDHSLEFHQLAMRALIPLVDTGEGAIGSIKADQWQRVFADVYDPEHPGYTMQFVKGE